MGWPEWTGSDIRALSVHRPRPPMARLDLLPFVIAYASWGLYCLKRDVQPFWVGFGFTSLVLLHVLTGLVQYWSLAMRCLIGYWPVRSIGGRDEDEIREGRLRIRAVPHPHKGKAEFAVLELDDTRIHFNFQKRSYEYNRELGRFELVTYPEHLKLKEYAGLIRQTGGLNEEARIQALIRYGLNRIEIPLPKFWDLYQEQLLSPFFVFQVFCILLWVLDAYWQYFAMTLGMMLIFEATTVKARLRSLTELRGMRNRPSKVNAYRNKKWVHISSLELLPGDVISLTRGTSPEAVVPCDCLIISGGAVVNEAMLTGESVPLMKEGIVPLSPEEEDDELNVLSKHKGFVLFGGTRVLSHTAATISEATPPSKAPDNGCVCIVLRTGFGSSQGILLRTILASTDRVTANSWEAALFILFLLVFAIFASVYVLLKGLEDEDRSHYKLLLRCVLIITSVIPPELPMQLSLAVNASLLSLAKQLVFCTEPFRIPYAGKVDVCCFDKTGTLTTDSIKAVGVALPGTAKAEDAKESEQLEYPLTAIKDASFDAASVLAGCHSLVYIDDELAGDPLELAALASVEWSYTRSEAAVPRKGSHGKGLKILHRHRFLSKLQRMSTIAQVQNSNVPLHPRVLVKGSAEAIGSLLAGEKPEYYDATAVGLARRGMRVLALAYKNLDASLTPSTLKNLPREEAERDLTFAGFVAFECPLRPDSRKNVKHLRNSSHKVVMITGDAVLTAVHVAKEVAICSKRTLVLEQDRGHLEWKFAATGARKASFDAKKIKDLAADYDLAVSGSSIMHGFPREDFLRIVPHIRVFARMAPEHKEHILTAYKEQGLLTLMCGDGTNDVGALKQAHVGVALLSFVSSKQPNGPSETSAAMIRMQKRGEAGQKSAAKAKSSAEKSATKKGPTAAGSSNSVRAAASSSANGQTSSSNGLDALSPEERRRRELKEKLDKQMKELDELMGEDEPKLVKLGDASIASPFTSKKMSIESCATIIRQGRCTLATTQQMYEILALNCLVSAYGLSVLYLDGVKFGDRQMTLSGIVIAAAFFFITRSQPLERLSQRRPPATVFHPSIFLSIMAQFAVHLVTLAVLVHISKGYLPENYDPDVDGDFKPNVLNTIVFLLSTAQQVVVFGVNCKGYPFMQGLMENRLLRNTLIINLIVVVLLALEVIPEFNAFAELAPLPDPALRYTISKWILIDAVGAFVVDRVVSSIFRPRVRQT
mmetsp:Transcript_3189/g.9719  ORF Transcript_3189/g.9719 Transcript_3189/m.9719 type:complete len:1218 (+) Transcript_3189:107-3760(+)